MRIGVLAIVFISCLFVSCRSDVERLVNPTPGTEVDTATANVPRFTDIPLPKGFELEGEQLKSNIHEAGHFRFGRQTFVGSARVIDLIHYFEERLPHHGWTLLRRDSSVEDRGSLLWRKSDTTARIEISTRKNGAVEVNLRVGTSQDPNYVP